MRAHAHARTHECLHAVRMRSQAVQPLVGAQRGACGHLQPPPRRALQGRPAARPLHAIHQEAQGAHAPRAVHHAPCMQAGGSHAHIMRQSWGLHDMSQCTRIPCSSCWDEQALADPWVRGPVGPCASACLQTQCVVHDMASATDYRRLAQHTRGLYFISTPAQVTRQPRSEEGRRCCTTIIMDGPHGSGRSAHFLTLPAHSMKQLA